MGNSDEITTSGVCRGLYLQLAKINVIVGFFPLKMGVSNVVWVFNG